MSSTEVVDAVKTLFDSVTQLEKLYPGRRFTLDGHLVGSVGEVLAAELYRLELLPASSECHDAVCPQGRKVQVKLTQSRRVSMYSQPDFLVVLALTADATLEEVYNGPGQAPWNAAGTLQKNGQRSIAVSRLRDLMESVPLNQKIVRYSEPKWLRGSRYASLHTAAE